MSKMKKVLLMGTAYVLVAALAIAGTLAYLTSTDADVNVMTLGDVEIEQIEQERDENGKLVSFTQGKTAYPAVGPVEWADEGVEVNGEEYKVFTEELKNVVDKIVTVNNTGKNDAYVRTIIAIEAPNGDPHDLIHLNYNGTDVTDSKGFIKNVDGVDYYVVTFTYKEAIKAGEKSAPSLMQVFLDKKTTNEDCALFGESWEIYAVSQAVQADGFTDPATALNAAFGEVNEDNASGMIADTIDKWDGTADTTWYNDTATTFELTTAEQMAGLAELVDGGNTFAGKTIKLENNISLYNLDENGNRVCFEPIGSYRNDQAFKGTFDGQGHTISDMYQNTWALDNGYDYGDLGMGFFALVEDATIKNLNMDGASVSGESALCGTVAATAYGDCTFENITVTNSDVADYLYYAGGLVAWASGNHTYKNINIEESTVVGSQWGDFGNANGGIVGGIGSSGTYHFEDCTIACRIDATNDIVSAYQWYNYRNSGMLVGRVPQTIVNGEVQTVKNPDNVTCKNVTVIYGDWANYTYCEFAGTRYPYVRVQAGTSVDAYSNVRYGHPTDANGNLVVDDNHVHNADEDHNLLVAFDQLFGGPADHHYCYYGIKSFDGVTVVYKKGFGVDPVATAAEANDAMKASNDDVLLKNCNDDNANIEIPDTYTGTFIIEDSKINSIKADGTANIVVKGDVVVKSTSGSAITGKNINITGEDDATLTAIADEDGVHAYGIGGDNTEAITIKDVRIEKVSGGYVQKECVNDPKYGKDEPEGGSAIGSGYNGAKITLTNVVIDEALGGSKSAGIGAKFWTGVNITITNSEIKKVVGGNASAGIGGSRVSKDATSAENITITIKDSVINAEGGQFGAGIGSGYDTHCGKNQPLCTVNISGSTINAIGGKYAAGVGSGYHNAALAGEIKDSTVNAVSGEKFYKAEYTQAQDIGFGVVDPAREGTQTSSKLIYNDTEIGIPAV